MTMRMDPASMMASAALATFLLCASTFANAAPFVVTASADGFGGTEDNGFGDLNLAVGVVSVIATLGDYDVNVITGITKPLFGGAQNARMDLSSTNFADGGTSQPLGIFFGDDSFEAIGSTPFKTEIGGTVFNADITWQTCIYDFVAGDAITCNPGTGPGGSFTGEGAFSETSTFNVELTGDYFMGLLAVITPDEFADDDVFVSFDYEITQVPLPAAAWLFGSALLGLGVLKRKKA